MRRGGAGGGEGGKAGLTATNGRERSPGRCKPVCAAPETQYMMSACLERSKTRSHSTSTRKGIGKSTAVYHILTEIDTNINNEYLYCSYYGHQQARRVEPIFLPLSLGTYTHGSPWLFWLPVTGSGRDGRSAATAFTGVMSDSLIQILFTRDIHARISVAVLAPCHRYPDATGEVPQRPSQQSCQILLCRLCSHRHFPFPIRTAQPAATHAMAFSDCCHYRSGHARMDIRSRFRSFLQHALLSCPAWASPLRMQLRRR